MTDKTEIFVFGSNLAGIHGAGSALEAVKNHGAQRGMRVGLQGNSYAIPTKDVHLRTLPLNHIQLFVEEFLIFTISHPELKFNVVEIGCGLAGYRPKDIAPFFRGAGDNVNLPQRFKKVLEK